MRGGGQNKKVRKGRGRPAGYNPAEAIAYIKELVRHASLCGVRGRGDIRV